MHCVLCSCGENQDTYQLFWTFRNNPTAGNSLSSHFFAGFEHY